MTSSSYEGRQGVVVFEKGDALKKIKKDLTIAPIVDTSFGGFPKKHAYYQSIGDGRIALPRFYDVPHKPTTKKYGRVDSADALRFAGALKASQPQAVAATLAAMRETGGAILSLAPGEGKCFARGTRVLMHDMSVKVVEDVVVGDAVMGDDATPRIVAALGRGRETMYDILVLEDGSSLFTCNESHILTMTYDEHRVEETSYGTWMVLAHEKDYFYFKIFKAEADAREFAATTDATVDMSVLAYLALPDVLHRRLKMFRAPPFADAVRTTMTFRVEKKDVDEYYGFSLEGTRHRFLLADFTVVHNTVCAISIACTLGLKTLIVVHKEFLMNQWVERIAQFAPKARVGRLQQKRAEVEDRDVVVAMIHSIALREYPPETFEGFGTVIVDEAHHVSAPVFSQAMFVANAPYVLGLTATPERKDGLQCVLRWFLGDIAYRSARENRVDVRVEVARFDASDVPIPVNQRTGKVCLSSFVTALTETRERNDLIVARVVAHVRDGRKIILLSDRRAHCEDIAKRLRVDHDIDAGLYLGGMTPENLDASAAKRVVIATFALATEGLDIPTLDTLILATPKSDVVQATGRILRETPGKKHAPLIVDVLDASPITFAQFNKRRTFYVASGFDVGGGGPKPSNDNALPSGTPMFIHE
jgi:superfamily II DNA or RNA helicase